MTGHYSLATRHSVPATGHPRRAQRGQGKAQEALELINHAIEVRGAVPSLVDTRAVVLIRAGQFDRALIDLDRAQTIDPRKPSLAFDRAWAYQAKGKTDEARRAFQQAKDLGWKLAAIDPLERSLFDQWGRELISGAGAMK